MSSASMRLRSRMSRIVITIPATAGSSRRLFATTSTGTHEPSAWARRTSRGSFTPDSATVSTIDSTASASSSG